MAKPTEQEIRKVITDLFIFEYIPKLKEEVGRFNIESLGKHQTAISVSEICGRPVGIELGELKIAQPTNELIDKIVEYVKVSSNG